MRFLNDTQAEAINGGGIMPDIKISVNPVVAVLPQTAISMPIAILGGRAISRQDQFGFLKA